MPNTSRLSLYKTDGNELTSPVNALHNQYDTIDSTAVATTISETEPVARFIGEEWWKASTKEFYTWNGLAWVEVDLVPSGPPPVSAPTGRKAFTVATNTSDFGTINTGEGPTAFIPTTFAATLGKKYEITFTGTVTCITSAGGNMQAVMTMRIASGSSVTTGGTLIHKVPCGRTNSNSGVATAYRQVGFRALWVATGTGNFTVGVFVRKETGFTGTLGFAANVYHSLAVEEVG